MNIVAPIYRPAIKRPTIDILEYIKQRTPSIRYRVIKINTNRVSIDSPIKLDLRLAHLILL